MVGSLRAGGQLGEEPNRAVGRESLEDFGLGGGQGTETKQGEPAGQEPAIRAVGDSCGEAVEEFGPAGMADLSPDGPEHGRLPAVVVVEGEGLFGSVVVAGPVVGQPGPEHGRPVCRVAVDEVGSMAGQGEGPVGVPEARHQVRGAMEDRQHGPRKALRQPAGVELVGEVERLSV